MPQFRGIKYREVFQYSLKEILLSSLISFWHHSPSGLRKHLIFLNRLVIYKTCYSDVLLMVFHIELLFYQKPLKNRSYWHRYVVTILYNFHLLIKYRHLMDYRSLLNFQWYPQSQVLFEDELSQHRIHAFLQLDHRVLFLFVEPNDKLNCTYMYSHDLNLLKKDLM